MAPEFPQAEGLAVQAGAVHPTMRDENGDPLISIASIEEYLRKEAVRYIKDAAIRAGIWNAEARKATEFLGEECKVVSGFIDKTKDFKKDYIETIRSMRMVSTTEVAAMMKPLEELRKFFLGDDHQEQINRLKEFVDLCERLEKLKKSGFLDTVADTLIKLA